MNFYWVDSSADQVAKNMSCEVRDEVLSLWLNLGQICLDYELGEGGYPTLLLVCSLGHPLAPLPLRIHMNDRRGSRRARRYWLS